MPRLVDGLAAWAGCRLSTRRGAAAELGARLWLQGRRRESAAADWAQHGRHASTPPAHNQTARAAAACSHAAGSTATGLPPPPSRLCGQGWACCRPRQQPLSRCCCRRGCRQEHAAARLLRLPDPGAGRLLGAGCSRHAQSGRSHLHSPRSAPPESSAPACSAASVRRHKSSRCKAASSAASAAASRADASLQ